MNGRTAHGRPAGALQAGIGSGGYDRGSVPGAKKR